MARKRSPGTGKPEPAESQTAEALTIGWLLSVFTTLACELAAAACYAIGGERLSVFGGLLLFSALVIGLSSIGIGAVAYRYRRVRPPRGVTVFAWTVGLLPVVVVVLQAFR